MTAISIPDTTKVRAIHNWGAMVTPGTAAGALAIGDAAYMDGSGDWLEADASAAVSAKARGIVVNSDDGDATVGDNDRISICLFGPVEGFTGMVEGAWHYVSDTAGAIDTAAGTVTFVIGYALTSTIFFVLPGANPESS